MINNNKLPKLKMAVGASLLKNRSILATASLGLLAPGVALAADLPARVAPLAPAPLMAPFNWTGFYVGAFGGLHGMERRNEMLVPGDICDPATFPEGRCETTRPWGGLLGATAGYNWQRGSFVYGIEADFGTAFNNGSSIAVINPAFPNAGGKSEVDMMGTLRARGGFLINDRTLFYLTAGYAALHQKTRFTFGYAGSKSDWVGGLVVGGGFEAAINNNWTVKGEALYIPETNRSRVLDATGPKFFSVKNKNHVIVKLGLNYRFGDGAAPVLARY